MAVEEEVKKVLPKQEKFKSSKNLAFPRSKTLPQRLFTGKTLPKDGLRSEHKETKVESEANLPSDVQ